MRVLSELHCYSTRSECDKNVTVSFSFMFERLSYVTADGRDLVVLHDICNKQYAHDVIQWE